MKYYQCFIDNQWVDALEGNRLTVDNPASGEIFAEVPACTATDAERALQSSERARLQWALLPPIERANYLYKICDGLKANAIILPGCPSWNRARHRPKRNSK